MSEQPKKLNERVLEDDYPVHPSYLYVVNGVVVTCHIEGTVGDLKREIGNNSAVITNCDMFNRKVGIFS